MVKTFLSFDVGTRNLAYCLLTFSQPKVIASCNILEWEVLDLGGAAAGVSQEKCALRLTRLLDDRFAFLRQDADNDDERPATLDYVLIERQPRGRSGIMVAVQMFLCQYFTRLVVDGRVKHVNFVSPRVKLNDAALLPPPHDAATTSTTSTTNPNGEPAGPSQRAQTSGRGRGNGRRNGSSRGPRGSWKRYNGNKCQTIETTRYLLHDVILDHAKLVEFDAAPKRDDMADAFMQCVVFFHSLSR